MVKKWTWNSLFSGKNSNLDKYDSGSFQIWIRPTRGTSPGPRCLKHIVYKSKSITTLKKLVSPDNGPLQKLPTLTPFSRGRGGHGPLINFGKPKTPYILCKILSLFYTGPSNNFFVFPQWPRKASYLVPPLTSDHCITASYPSHLCSALILNKFRPNLLKPSDFALNLKCRPNLWLASACHSADIGCLQQRF